MPCCGDREKAAPVALEEQWDYMNLDDFRSESCLSGFSYFFLFLLLFISIAVYAVDTFTAVTLLAFSRWAGQIEPQIPFEYSRWIFAVCIFLSFALLAWRWFHAIRAMRSGSVSQSYLNSLAARVQSVRIGKRGRGWRRFLVFGELTKSKKGAEYIALFAYFAFENWMNTLFADGPRQVVNAITLYSVMQMDLLPGGANTVDEDKPGALQFFDNVRILAEENSIRALVLLGMLFTLVIWVLSIIKLALAIILYVVFLSQHIPERDGSLKAYCRRKINARLKRIVHVKVNKALAKGVALQDRAPTGTNLGFGRKPTLPVFEEDDKTPIVSTLSRTATSTTMTTLPPYSSRPGTAPPREPEPTLPAVATFLDKPSLIRTATQSSGYSDTTSFSPASAVSAFSPLDRQASPAPPVPSLPDNVSMMPGRTGTPMSRSNFTPSPYARQPPSRMGSAGGTQVPRERHNPYSPEGYNGSTSGTPFRPYGASPDPHTRNITPGLVGTRGAGVELDQYSPEGYGGSNSGSPFRSYARTTTPAAAVTAGDAVPMRSFTPASQGRTATRPSPQSAYPPPSLTPGSQAPQAQEGYTAYNAQPNQGAAISSEPEYESVSEYGREPAPGQAYSSRSFTPYNPQTQPQTRRPDRY